MRSGFGKYLADYEFSALWYIFGPKDTIVTTTTIIAVVIRLNGPPRGPRLELSVGENFWKLGF